MQIWKECVQKKITDKLLSSVGEGTVPSSFKTSALCPYAVYFSVANAASASLNPVSDVSTPTSNKFTVNNGVLNKSAALPCGKCGCVRRLGTSPPTSTVGAAGRFSGPPRESVGNGYSAAFDTRPLVAMLLHLSIAGASFVRVSRISCRCCSVVIACPMIAHMCASVRVHGACARVFTGKCEAAQIYSASSALEVACTCTTQTLLEVNYETCSNCNRPPIHPHRKRTFSTVPKKSWRISPRVRFPPFRVASSTSAIMWARAAATGHRAAASTSASLRHRSGLMGSPSAAARANNFAWMCTDVIERIGERGKAL